MKKTLSIALIVVLMLSLAVGCAPKAAPAAPAAAEAPQAAAAAFKDGTYTAKGEADERGWVPEITVTVKDGKIADVKYDETTGLKKSQDEAYKKAFMDQKQVDLLKVYAEMQNGLIEKQDITKVDAVTGATGSFESFKALAAKALEGAKDGDKYKDGDYKAAGTEDERGWTPMVSINVKEGKIAAVTYDEVSSKQFSNKSTDAAYREAFKKNKNVDIVAAYEALQKSLIEKQDPTKVDAYAGATHAYDSFVALAAKALEQAK